MALNLGYNSLSILNLIFYGINCFFTFAQSLWGRSNTELSEKYMTLVTPNGWAFSIWGLIFFGEAAFVIAPFFSEQIRESKLIQDGVGYWWIAACTFQSAWSVAFAQEVIWLSFVLMLSILLSLGMILFKSYSIDYTLAQFWISLAPFQLHFGWITAASCVNASVVVTNALGCIQGEYDTCGKSEIGKLVTSSIIIIAFVWMFALWLSGFFGLQRPQGICVGVAAWALVAISDQLKHLEADFEEFYRFIDDDAIVLGFKDATLTIGLFLCVTTAADILWALGYLPSFDFMGKPTVTMLEATHP